MSDWELIQDLFEQGLALDGEKRQSLLEPYQHKKTVIREVSELWQFSNPEQGNLAQLKEVSQEIMKHGAQEKVPKQIGVYKVLEAVGEGMSGSVYKALKEGSQRPVALKVLKHRMFDKDFERRFLAERDMLFMLNHPNIALLFDSDLAEGDRPFLVMEYLDGLPITEYCDKHNLSIYERLDLFIQVCQGLAEAHKKGIIHRDIKPGNILVVKRGGVAVPKILDFGIAKFLDDPGRDLTMAGAVIGTPAYMSPEQANGRKVEMNDIRTDIYSLGVLLHEMLTGVTPLDREICEAGSLMSVCRIIDETDPQTPTRRIDSQMDHFTQSAAARNHTPSSLKQAVSGELEWIVMKAISKRSNDRYQSCSDFEDDLNRYMRGEAVLAGSPSQFYLLRKAIRKHRGFAAFTMLIVTAFLLISHAWYRANQAEKLAVARALETSRTLLELQMVQSFITEIFRGVDPKHGDRGLSGRALLERAVQEVGPRYQNRPELEAATRKMLGDALLGMGDHDEAMKQYDLAFTLMNNIYGHRHEKTLDAMSALAFVHMEMGDFLEAERLYRQMFDTSQEVYGTTHITTLKGGSGLAFALRRLGRRQEALGLFSSLISIQREVLPLDDPTLTATLSNYAGCLAENREYAKAEVLYQEIHQINQRYLGINHPRTLHAMHNLGWIAQRQKQLEKAEKIYRKVLAFRTEVLGPHHPRTLETLGNLAGAVGDQDRPGAAVSLLEPVYEPAFAEQNNHPAVLRLAHNLGHFLMMCERYDQAETVLLDTLEKRRAVHGLDNILTYRTWYTLVENYLETNQKALAAEQFNTLLKTAEQHLGPKHEEIKIYKNAWEKSN